MPLKARAVKQIFDCGRLSGPELYIQCNSPVAKGLYRSVILKNMEVLKDFEIGIRALLERQRSSQGRKQAACGRDFGLDPGKEDS